MTRKTDAKHVEDFALEPVRNRPDRHETSGSFVCGQRNLQAQPRVVRERIKNGDEIEAFFATRPVDGGIVLEQVEFLFVAGITGNFSKLSSIDDKIRLLAIF